MNKLIIVLAFLILFSGLASADLFDLTNLKAYYSFNETTGNLRDLHNSINQKIINGITYNSTGIITTAYVFNSSSSQFTSNTTHSIIQPTNADFTINLWVNGTNSTMPNDATIFFIGNTSVNNYYTRFRLKPSYNLFTPNVSIDTNAGTDHRNYGNVDVLDGTYHMISALYNQTGQYLYVDNVFQTQSLYTKIIFQNGQDTMCFGATCTTINYNFFNGSVDEASIWNRSLTTNELSLLYNSGAGISYDTLVNKTSALDNCTLYSTEIYNITLYDEDDKFFINISNNTQININLDLIAGNIVNSLDASYSLVNPLRLCSQLDFTNITNSIDLTLEYSADDYVTEFYNKFNDTFNGSSKDIKLYDLTSLSSTEYKINLKDDTFLPAPNRILEIERVYVGGATEIVEAPLTDSLGSTIGHFVSNDVLYNIYVKDENNVIAIYNNIRVYCSTGTDCTLNLNIPSSTLNIDSFQSFLGIKYSTTYDDSTGIYNLYYLSDGVISRTVNISAFRFDTYGNESLCQTQQTSSNGVVTCTFFADDINQSVLIKAYVNGDLLFTDYINLDYDNVDDFTAIKYLLAGLLLPMMVLMVAFSGAIALIVFILGLGFVVGIYLIDTQGIIGVGSFIIWLVVSAGILLWKMSKGGVKNG